MRLTCSLLLLTLTGQPLTAHADARLARPARRVQLAPGEAHNLVTSHLDALAHAANRGGHGAIGAWLYQTRRAARSLLASGAGDNPASTTVTVGRDGRWTHIHPASGGRITLSAGSIEIRTPDPAELGVLRTRTIRILPARASARTIDSFPSGHEEWRQVTSTRTQSGDTVAETTNGEFRR